MKVLHKRLLLTGLIFLCFAAVFGLSACEGTVLYYLSVRADGEGGSVTGTGTYVANTEITITAQAKLGYVFTGWYDRYGDLVSTETDYTLITGYTNAIYTAKFVDDVPFKVYINVIFDGGEVVYEIQGLDADGIGYYFFRETVRLNVVTENGAFFKGWYVDNDLISMENDYEFSMPGEDVDNITAIFSAHDMFHSGNGSEQFPYLIMNEMQLRSILEGGLDKHYALCADIDLENPWTPLGTSDTATGQGGASNPFTGTFDGNGFTVSDVSVENVNFSGLFGYAKNAKISNLNVENFTSTITHNLGSHIFAGAVVGMASGIEIENCSVYGTMTVIIASTSKGSTFGGLAGILFPSTSRITNCSSEIELNVNVNSSIAEVIAGGLIGAIGFAYQTDVAVISNCFAAGNVTLHVQNGYPIYGGGLIGYSNGTGISDCYSTGNVIASGRDVYIGGLLGGMLYTSILNCYASGDVHGDASSYMYIGGLVGYSNYSQIQNSLALGSMTGSSVTIYSGWVCSGWYETPIVNCFGYTGQSMDFGDGAVYNEAADAIGDEDLFDEIFFINTLMWDADIWDFLDLSTTGRPRLKVFS